MEGSNLQGRFRRRGHRERHYSTPRTKTCPWGPRSTAQRVRVWRLDFRRFRFAHVRKKPGMGSAASCVVGAGLVQAEGAVHRQPDIRGVLVLLAVVLPPANRAQAQRFGRLQRLISAAWAAKTSLHSFPQDEWTAIEVASLHEGGFQASRLLRLR